MGLKVSDFGIGEFGFGVEDLEFKSFDLGVLQGVECRL